MLIYKAILQSNDNNKKVLIIINRSQADKEARFAEATHTVLTRPPDFLIRLIGKETFEANTKLLLEGLQDPLLNRQMLFSMLDVVLWELFPELRTMHMHMTT